MTESGNVDLPVGLETRNVFFDTEVFRSCGHNLNSGLMWVFGCYMDDGVFEFHTTDVTLREVARQLHVLERQVTVRANKVAGDLRRWNKRYRRKQDQLPVPELLSEPVDPGAAYREFERIVSHEWGAREHRAADLLAGPVIDRYFANEPPFDELNSKKEFPDAFALVALEDWCSRTEQRIYVVSKDQAVFRAANASEHLIGVESLERLLSLVASAEGHDVGQVVLTAFEEPSSLLLGELRQTLSRDIGSALFVYAGDRDDAEVRGVEIVEVDDLDDVTVLRVGQDRVACVAHVRLVVSAEIHYLDFDPAQPVSGRDDHRFSVAISLLTHVEDRVGAYIFFEVVVDDEAVTLFSARFFSRPLFVTDTVGDDYRNFGQDGGLDRYVGGT